MHSILKNIWHLVALCGILFAGFSIGFYFGGLVGGVLGIILSPFIVLFFIDDSHETTRRSSH